MTTPMKFKTTLKQALISSKELHRNSKRLYKKHSSLQGNQRATSIQLRTQNELHKNSIDLIKAKLSYAKSMIDRIDSDKLKNADALSFIRPKEVTFMVSGDENTFYPIMWDFPNDTDSVIIIARDASNVHCSTAPSRVPRLFFRMVSGSIPIDGVRYCADVDMFVQDGDEVLLHPSNQMLSSLNDPKAEKHHHCPTKCGCFLKGGTEYRLLYSTKSVKDQILHWAENTVDETMLTSGDDKYFVHSIVS